MTPPHDHVDPWLVAAPPGETTYAVRARWLLPIDTPPIDGGLLTVRDDRIVAIGANLSGRAPHDLGDVALLPAWVNAHTHLEFSLLQEPLGRQGDSFPQWIRHVVAHRRQLAEQLGEEGAAAHRRSAILAGCQELLASGCNVCGDINASDDSAADYDPRIDRFVLFREALGLGDDQRLLDLTQEHLDRCDAAAVGGVNPHAPYTVSWSAMQLLAQLSAKRRVAFALHLAESMDELELLQAGSGRLVELLRELNAWKPDAVPRGLRPLDYLQVASQAHRALIIHGNFLTQEEIDFCGEHRQRLSVVYCPRTQEHLVNARYPLAELLDSGANVALGTDSRASSPDLNLRRELRRAAERHPQIAAPRSSRHGDAQRRCRPRPGRRLWLAHNGKKSQLHRSTHQLDSRHRRRGCLWVVLGSWFLVLAFLGSSPQTGCPEQASV